MDYRIFAMNSCMMPNDGIYERQTITAADARTLWHDVSASRRLSFLGYPNVLKIAREVLDDSGIALSREQTTFSQGDVAICFQLKYRLLTPAEKEQNLHGSHADDYVISFVRYREK